LYYSCNDKKPYAFYCREDKECVTPPCVDYQCSGTPIPTYINYTTTLPTNRTISIDDVFNITVSYLISSNNSAPPVSGCIIYVDDILQSYSLCGTISIQITSVGVHNVRISGQALGYETASTPDIQVIVINPVGANYSIGSRCDMDSNCASGRCEFVQEQYYRRCRTNSDCLQGGTCSGADSFLNLQGWCSNLVSYGICCANDTMQCCDPLGWARCDNAYSGFQCSAATYTCSQVTKSAGTQCNSQLDCNPGLLCLPNTGTYKYCCAATSTLDMCCNIDSECPSGYVCDSAYGGTYVCTKPSGGPGLEEPCSSTHQCIGEEGAALTCKNGICQPFECKRGVPCVICLNSTGQRVYMTAIECGISNNTRSVYCAVSMAQCNNEGGQQTSVGGVVSGTTIEDLFNQILVLLFWAMIAVIFFFIIAMFISGLHLAYGLVKK